jgi:predicted porin
MNKKLLAAAVVSALTASPAAFSAVTVYGHLDVGIQSMDNDDPAYAGSELFMGSNYGSGGSFIGFRASEDLGGGLKANAVAELGMNADDGTLDNAGAVSYTPTLTTTGTAAATASASKLFQRQIYAGLAGGFGSINAGRQYSEGFLLQGTGSYNSTAGAIGTYFLNTSIPVRVDNFLKYSSPSFGGVTIVAGYGLGEGTTGATEDNKFTELGVKYAAGPIRAGVVLETTTSGVTDLDTVVAAGQWSFGPATVYLTYSQTENDATPVTVDHSAIALGGKYTIGNGDIVLQVGQRKNDATAADDDATLMAIAYYHRLSKTTLLYTAYGTVDNDTAGAFGVPRQQVATVAGGSPSALFAGLRITF